MANYIVRIYRQNKEDPDDILGFVEEVETERKLSFSSRDELMGILCSVKKDSIITTKNEGSED